MPVLHRGDDAEGNPRQATQVLGAQMKCADCDQEAVWYKVRLGDNLVFTPIGDGTHSAAWPHVESCNECRLRALKALTPETPQAVWYQEAEAKIRKNCGLEK